MKRLKQEVALPALAVTTPESSSLTNPIRDRLRIPILVPELNELPYLLICLFETFEISVTALEVVLSFPFAFSFALAFVVLALPFSLLRVL